MREVNRVVVLGANGAMGAGCGLVFARAGLSTVFLARTREKAEAGRARAAKRARDESLAARIEVGGYDDRLAEEVAGADLVFEAVAEDAGVKRALLAEVDRARRPGTVVATVSSGLSIAALCAGRSADLARSFLGMHFFNPPHVITGCELVPHAGTDPAVVAAMAAFLRDRLGRELVVTADTPAFCGNRIGFKVLNECAQLAAEHGAAFVDALAGPHTGRAMGPLATVDFVGWDVHRAIVDHLHANTRDEAHDAFALPAFMHELMADGHLGDKTADKGGFFRRGGAGKDAPRLALEPRRRAYVTADAAVPEAARRMCELHAAGRHVGALDVLAHAGGDGALMRRIVLGYIGYALGRVGEVVERVEDVDRIMAHGFRWAPPGLLCDLLGARRTIRLLDEHALAVPPVLVRAADSQRPLCPQHDPARYFPVAAAAA
ncbi:MAG TPA: 3-hydroxyacyl-CoA dehydrogenase family protein [Kofleriaceae bacterium]|nr:3-hydroxyacyl-CoA dehydrogenase family protein [Kofleriaceae bacterium]